MTRGELVFAFAVALLGWAVIAGMLVVLWR